MTLQPLFRIHCSIIILANASQRGDIFKWIAQNGKPESYMLVNVYNRICVRNFKQFYYKPTIFEPFHIECQFSDFTSDTSLIIQIDIWTLVPHKNSATEYFFLKIS